MTRRKAGELSQREQDVAELLDGGDSVAEAAGKLGVSKGTVKEHRQMINLTRRGNAAQES